MNRFIVLVIALLLLAGCSTATPAPASIPSPATWAALPGNTAPAPTMVSPTTSSPTIASTPVDSAALFNSVATLLKSYTPVDSDPAPLHAALADAVIQFLTATSNADTPLAGQPALDALAQGLTALKLPDQVKPAVATAHLRDSEGGSEDIVLVSLEELEGLPIVVLHRLGTSWQVLDIGGPSMVQGETGPTARSFYPGTVQAADLTGDGVGEILYSYNLRGASANNEELHVMRWNEDAQKLKTIFQATLVSWAGVSKYTLVAGAKGQNLQIAYPWFGVFDHKMAEHPQATQVWAYDPGKDQLVQQSEKVDPAKTVRQQLNVAEVLFRQGALDKATPEYERAWKDTTLAEEDSGGTKAATRAFARFRQGQLLALTGQTAAAKAALVDAQKAGGDVGALASAFIKNYTGTDAAVRAWAALPGAVDLYQSFNQDKTNLNFPANATDILFKGEIVAAYLDAHPTAGTQLVNGLRSLGLNPTSLVSTDLDGDGQPEYLFLTPEGTAEQPLQSLWLVYRGQTRWLARSIMQEPSLTLDPNPIALKNGKGSAIRIQLPPNTQPSVKLLTWDRTRVIDLDPQTMQPLSPAPAWPVLGTTTPDMGF